MAETQKPLPNIDRWNRPFWDAAREHRLVAQRCQDCGHLHIYPSPAYVCTECLSNRQEWVPLSGRGYIWSYVVYHHLWHPGFKDDLPYAVALIQLDEGLQAPGNIVGAAPEELDVGLRVEVTFEAVSTEVTVPKFRPSEPRELVTHPLSQNAWQGAS